MSFSRRWINYADSIWYKDLEIWIVFINSSEVVSRVEIKEINVAYWVSTGVEMWYDTSVGWGVKEINEKDSLKLLM